MATPDAPEVISCAGLTIFSWPWVFTHLILWNLLRRLDCQSIRVAPPGARAEPSSPCVAACLVGIAALFRWVEIRYGLFPAFGVVGALLLVVAVACATMARARLQRPPPQFPSLTSRLRVAIKTNPLQPDQIGAARDTAEDILLAPSAPAPRRARGPSAPFATGETTEPFRPVSS